MSHGNTYNTSLQDLNALFELTGNQDIVIRGHEEIQSHLPELEIIEHRAELTEEETEHVYMTELVHSKGFRGFPARRLASYSDTKRKMLRSIIQDTKESSKFLIFNRMKQEAKWIKEAISDLSVDIGVIDGRTSKHKRNKILNNQANSQLDTAGTLRSLSTWHQDLPECILAVIESYENRKKHHVVIIHAEIGSVGLNLQIFSDVIYPTPEWSPMDIVQGTCRIYRWKKDEGERKKVRSHLLVTTTAEDAPCKTFDQQVLNIQNNKDKLIQEFVGEYFGQHKRSIQQH